MDQCFEKSDGDLKVNSMCQRMRGFQVRDGWLPSARHTRSRNIEGTEKQVQLIWQKSRLNEYRSKRFSQNLLPRTAGISTKQASLHCKLLQFFNSNLYSPWYSAPPDRGLATQQMSGKKKDKF